MKLYDIAQELFQSVVFPGDPKPTYQRNMQILSGDVCNLTEINMCVHNGTHMDAPYHFYQDGKTIDQIDLEKCVGKATVVTAAGILTAEKMLEILAYSEKRLLLKGEITITPEAAQIMSKEGVKLIGVEGQTVGPLETPKEVHLILLKDEIVILEGIRLQHVPDGYYLLSAAPINLGGSDGAPCRPILIELEA